MKSRRSIIIVLPIFIVSTIVMIGIHNVIIPVTEQETKINYKSLSLNSLIPHDKISVSDDSQLAQVATRGSGTSSDPYIIENLLIQSDTSGIFIIGTNQHFKIQNCYINSTGAAIVIGWRSEGSALIINNSCLSENSGFIGDSTGELTISNNNFSHCENGLYLENCQNSIITNNICNYNLKCGISIDKVEELVIENNICNDNGEYGIKALGFKFFDTIVIQNNTFNNNGLDGLVLSNYELSIISNNYASDNGIDGIKLVRVQRSNITDNTCDNNERKGIYCTINCHSLNVYGNTCTNNTVGIFADFEYYTPSIFQNNNCTANKQEGIRLDFCQEEIYLLDNFCSKNTYGINVWVGSEFYLINNTCYSNDLGIYIFESTQIALNDNKLNLNNNGIFLQKSNHVKIERCVTNNNKQGLNMSNGDSNLISLNRFEKNENYAIILDVDSTNNLIWNNCFLQNGGNNSQAYDDGEGNNWNNTEVGNYWSNISQIYYIDGSSSSQDNYPLETIPITSIIPSSSTTLSTYSSIEPSTTTSMIKSDQLTTFFGFFLPTFLLLIYKRKRLRQ